MYTHARLKIDWKNVKILKFFEDFFPNTYI